MTELAGTTWVVVAVSRIATKGSRRPNVTFDPDGRVHGSAGVNRYFASYSVADEAVTFGTAGSTMMAGPEELMEQEDRFLGSLQGTKLLHWTDAGLTLGYGDGQIDLEPTTREESAQ